MSARSLRVAGALVAGLGLAAAPCRATPDCFETLAQTRNFTLGQPRHVVPLRDGTHVLYLRSGPRDTRLRLFEFDAGTRSERELAAPSAEPEHLSAEERARRERARMTLSGIVDFAASDSGSEVMITQADTLTMVALPSASVSPVPGRGWIAPRLSPDGRAVAAVRDHDLHVVELDSGQDVRLTQDGAENLTRGVAEFAAAEELDRADGAWWSPDSQRLLYEEADSSAVEQHFIADPSQPQTAPTAFRYPRAGTANANIRFGLIARSGGPTTWVKLDAAAWPYVARVVWPRLGRLSLVVLNRSQTREAVIAVDPKTGDTATLLTESDPAWLDLTAMNEVLGRAMPAWLPDGSGFLWAANRGATWQLELRRADGALDHAITPAGWPFLAFNDADVVKGRAVVTGNPDRLSLGLYSVDLKGGLPLPLAAQPGLHTASFADDMASKHANALFADTVSLADGEAGTVLRSADGRLVAELPSHAETPARVPVVQYLTAGPRGLDAAVIRPKDFAVGHRYPVVLSVYAGPTVKVVQRAPRLSLENQCLADHGFIVASLDGRGTPGRGHDFEHATRGNLIDLPLADQIEGLKALGTLVPEMDMRHVGVEGWSFGGYFTAMATIRRPDVFSAGVAGAPVIDFADYDTAYTERYLGTPQNDAAGYKASNVLTYAASLSRPLLIMHGLTDDNVYFENTVKLTQALIAAGKPYRLLLLPGTHLLPDPLVRARVDEARAGFLLETLAK